MSIFENGISGYVKGTFLAEVYFPVDNRGNAHIKCSMCYYFNSNTNRCRLNGEVCAFPDKYIGGNCPLNFDDFMEETNND